MKDADILDFVYCRCFEEDQRLNGTTRVGDSLQRLYAESERFLRALVDTCPNRTPDCTRLLSVLQANPEHEKEISHLLTTLKAPGGVSFGYTATRVDDDPVLLEKFAHQWRQLLLTQATINRRERLRFARTRFRFDGKLQLRRSLGQRH